MKVYDIILENEQIPYTNPARIKQWLEALRVENYAIRKDGVVDVHGDVNLSIERLRRIPIQFGEVSGHFQVDVNLLVSLHGCPYEVGKDFHCDHNKLETLEGGPREVGGSYYCQSNFLTSLKGAPREVGDNFYCDDNHLTNLIGAPRIVHGNFSCAYNEFEKGPDHSHINIGGNFYCAR